MQGLQVILCIIHTSQEITTTTESSIKDVERINNSILEVLTSWEPVLARIFQRVLGTHVDLLVPCDSPGAEAGPRWLKRFLQLLWMALSCLM